MTSLQSRSVLRWMRCHGPVASQIPWPAEKLLGQLVRGSCYTIFLPCPHFLLETFCLTCAVLKVPELLTPRSIHFAPT